jgi:hypothetical protein
MISYAIQTPPPSVTDCVAVPELRLLIYYIVTVNYGAENRCYGRLKRCYGWVYRVVLVRRAWGPQYTHWYLPSYPLRSTPSQMRPLSMPRMFATHEAIAMNAS